MKVRLLHVGKARDRDAIALHDRYAARIRRFGVEYSDDWVAEVQSGGRFDDEHVRERESRSLLQRIDARGMVVALDRAGRSMSSVELSRRVETWATPRVTLVIGGPLGLHGLVRERADWLWSLSELTLPHEMARVLVAEQIYRALTILRGVPYHK